jgi:CRP/FNR family transcriptional regulator, cyclic AMP receptor protein
MRKILFILGQLTDVDVEWLIGHGRKRDIPTGTVLVHEGQPIDMLFIVLRGQLEVHGAYLQGTGIRLGSGEIVGEVSLLDSRPPIATVTSIEPSTVLAIPRADIADHLNDDMGFAVRFYRALAVLLAQRLRNTGMRLGDGKAKAIEDDVEYSDELSPEVLDSVHVAGARFERVLQRLLSQS